MRKIDLAQFVTILANIGVLAGIVFLAFEIRQNTAQMRAEAAASVHQDLQRLNEALYQDREFAEFIVRAEQSFSSLDDVDKRRAANYFFSEQNLADFVMGLSEDGLSDVSVDIVDVYLAQFKSMPGRAEFVDEYIRKRNIAGAENAAMRSEVLYRRLLEE